MNNTHYNITISSRSMATVCIYRRIYGLFIIFLAFFVFPFLLNGWNSILRNFHIQPEPNQNAVQNHSRKNREINEAVALKRRFIIHTKSNNQCSSKWKMNDRPQVCNVNVLLYVCNIWVQSERVNYSFTCTYRFWQLNKLSTKVYHQIRSYTIISIWMFSVPNGQLNGTYPIRNEIECRLFFRTTWNVKDINSFVEKDYKRLLSNYLNK